MTATLDIEVAFRDHGRRIFWAAWRRLENWHDAEDAAQNAVVRALELNDRADLAEINSMGAWLTAVARWEALAILRHHQRYVAAGDWASRFADEQEERAADTGGPCIAEPETCADVYGALAALDDQQRLAVQMLCLQGMDKRDAARCLRLSPSAVTDLMRTALRKLERASRWERKAAARREETDGPRGEPDADLTRLMAEPNAAARLTPQQRRVVELRVQGFSLSQVGKRLSIAEKEVRHTVGAAKRRLREPEGAAQIRRAQAASHLPRTPPSPHVLRVLNTPHLLDALPPRQREAIILRFREGLSTAETAARMGATTPAISQMTQKVMQRERRRFAEQAVTQ